LINVGARSGPDIAQRGSNRGQPTRGLTATPRLTRAPRSPTERAGRLSPSEPGARARSAPGAWARARR